MMYGRGYGYGFNDMMGWYGFGGWLMLFFGLLVLAGFALLIVWAVRASAGHQPQSGHVPPARGGQDEAIAIARRRLASGEIDKGQYEEIMHALGD